MADSSFYMDLPYDLAGSRSKNRFRYELLWGLKKMIILLKENKEFKVVFDYVCDIEFHLDTHFEFYQLKSQNNGAYTVNKLLKIDKGKNWSILANLYRLKYDKNLIENKDTCLYIVSNSPLNDGKKTHNDSEEVSLDSISDASKDKIKTSIKEELKLSDNIDLSKSYFIRTSMNLINPEDEIIGAITILFEQDLKCKCKSATALYKVLFSEISSKACYELKLNGYSEIIEKKGLTSDQLNYIVKQYIEKSDNSIEKTKQFIDSNYNMGRRIKLKGALRNILSTLGNNGTLKNIEKEIIRYIYENEAITDNEDMEIINIIKSHVSNMKTIEISEDEIEILILLTLKRCEEEVYE